MGAPGIEAGHPVITVYYPRLLKYTGTTDLRGLRATTAHSVLPQPPTYEPPKSHTYKCPGGQL
jgi:hypothetical protein